MNDSDATERHNHMETRRLEQLAAVIHECETRATRDSAGDSVFVQVEGGRTERKSVVEAGVMFNHIVASAIYEEERRQHIVDLNRERMFMVQRKEDELLMSRRAKGEQRKHVMQEKLDKIQSTQEEMLYNISV